jgi:dephospho-CoA kinase
LILITISSAHPLAPLGVRAPNQEERICRIIAVVGLIGAGKTTATPRFTARGFVRVGFNDVIYQELDQRGLGRTENEERRVREELRKAFGMGVVATRALPIIESLVSEGKRVVIESLYSWSEYKILKERFGEDLRVLAIYAPPHLRYERLAKRAKRSYSPDVARSRDYAQIEHLEQAGPIAMADWTINNTATKKDFYAQTDALIKSLTDQRTWHNAFYPLTVRSNKVRIKEMSRTRLRGTGNA